VKRQELISKSCCLHSQEETPEQPAEEVTDGAMVWNGSQSLFPRYGYLVHLDTQKQTPITGTASRHLPARNTAVKEKFSLNNCESSL